MKTDDRTILDTIVERTRAGLDERRQAVPEAMLQMQIRHRPPPRDFAAALRRPAGAAPRVIAELKKASPSKGLIRADFAPQALALELAAAGAAALSVLTEPHFFQGAPEFLRRAAALVEIPVLRKDFIVDPFQVLEARAWGADAILLIAAALDDKDYSRLFRQARALGLGVLTEVHTAEELDRVLDLGVHVVGVNSRDLKTFTIDLNRAETLLAAIPDTCVRVAESGIRTGADMRRLCRAGADAFLIGETLMRQPEPGAALRALLESADLSTAAPTTP